MFLCTRGDTVHASKVRSTNTLLFKALDWAARLTEQAKQLAGNEMWVGVWSTEAWQIAPLEIKVLVHFTFIEVETV